jgi:hypothetical protein
VHCTLEATKSKPCFKGVTGFTLSNVLGDLRAFLKAHPDEFVYLRPMVQDPGPDFQSNFNAILNRYEDILWCQDPRDAPPGDCKQGGGSAGFVNPTLDEVRGKVVLLKSFPDGQDPAINSYGMKTGGDDWTSQTFYQFKSNWDLYKKWKLVLENWTAAVDHYPRQGGGPHSAFWNSLNAAEGSFPYFVASGKSSPEGPLLSTGLLNHGVGKLNGKKVYPDFHWTACVAGGTCTVAFTGINLLMYDVLAGLNRAGKNHPGLRDALGMGVISIDFPGQPLVDEIIANNPWEGDIEVSSSQNPSSTGSEVTFTAKVTPEQRTGTVKFTANGEAMPGSVPGHGTDDKTCSAVPVKDDGVARWQTHFGRAGDYHIVAEYSGSKNVAPIESEPFTQTVTN